MAEAAASADAGNVRADFERLVAEAQGLRRRVVQLEAQEREHKIASEVLQTLEEERRCFRLVGDVLTEQTAAEARESVQGHMERIRAQIKADTDRALEIETEIKDIAAKAR